MRLDKDCGLGFKICISCHHAAARFKLAYLCMLLPRTAAVTYSPTANPGKTGYSILHVKYKTFTEKAFNEISNNYGVP